ncbi:MAG: hypothetical protein KBT02_08415 [Treponema sp.]|nr:hypothetical protein [Candidatus Treponema caballi]
MKNYDKQPTAENIENALKNNALNLNERIFKVSQLLDHVNEATSICLDGKWGSGKTFFVKELQFLLDSLNPFSECKHESIENLAGKPELTQTYATVYFDAWENDLHNDPLLSLLYIIARQFSLEYKWEKFDFDSAIKQVIGTLVSSIPFLGKTIDVKELMNGKYVNDLMDTIKKENNLQKEIIEFFSKLSAERGDRILIIIDELDRCRPDYAIQLLERIKHYMSCEQITFLFAMNENELEYIVKQYYGQEFNATGYLDKFFDLRLNLPEVPIETYLQYLEFDINSSCFKEIICKEVISYLGFQKREINRFLKYISIILDNYERRGNFGFCEDECKDFIIHIIFPCLIGLKLKSTEKYNAFINGTDCSILVHVLSGEHFEYYQQKICSKSQNKDDLVQNINTFCQTLFVYDFPKYKSGKSVGQYILTPTHRKLILDLVSMISDYSVF